MFSTPSVRPFWNWITCINAKLLRIVWSFCTSNQKFKKSTWGRLPGTQSGVSSKKLRAPPRPSGRPHPLSDARNGFPGLFLVHIGLWKKILAHPWPSWPWADIKIFELTSLWSDSIMLGQWESCMARTPPALKKLFSWNCILSTTSQIVFCQEHPGHVSKQITC